MTKTLFTIGYPSFFLSIPSLQNDNLLFTCHLPQLLYCLCVCRLFNRSSVIDNMNHCTILSPSKHYLKTCFTLGMLQTYNGTILEECCILPPSCSLFHCSSLFKKNFDMQTLCFHSCLVPILKWSLVADKNVNNAGMMQNYQFQSQVWVGTRHLSFKCRLR